MHNSKYYFSAITHRDLSDIKKLQPEGWSDIIPEITYYIDSNFCSPIKIMSDNGIVGIGASISLGKTCWLAHIIVDYSYRNMGLGLRIVNKLLNDIENRDQKSILLIATDLGEPVYKKVGFKIVTEYAVFKRESSRNNMISFENIVRYKEDFRERIYEMDRMITGEDRTNILASTIQSSMIYLQDGKMSGYFVPKLGDGTIIAESKEAGIELMKLKFNSTNKAVIPVENKAGIKFLKENGFRELSPVKRMILGQDIGWKPENIYNRISGNFG